MDWKANVILIIDICRFEVLRFCKNGKTVNIKLEFGTPNDDNVKRNKLRKTTSKLRTFL